MCYCIYVGTTQKEKNHYETAHFMNRLSAPKSHRQDMSASPLPPPTHPSGVPDLSQQKALCAAVPVLGPPDACPVCTAHRSSVILTCRQSKRHGRVTETSPLSPCPFHIQWLSGTQTMSLTRFNFTGSQQLVTTRRCWVLVWAGLPVTSVQNLRLLPNK